MREAIKGVIRSSPRQQSEAAVRGSSPTPFVVIRGH